MSGVENVTGTQQADTLTGDAGDNQLEGLAGGDEITGGGGRDTLVAADGADAIRARDGIADRSIDCGPGADVAELDLTGPGLAGLRVHHRLRHRRRPSGPPRQRGAAGRPPTAARGRVSRARRPRASHAAACCGCSSRGPGAVCSRAARYAVARGTVGVVVVESPRGFATGRCGP